MGNETVVGGNLEEIYKGGKKLLPPVAQSFSGAAAAISRASAKSPFSHDGDLGLGAEGPNAAYDDLREAIGRCCRNSGEVMQDVADNVVKTAQDFARLDAERARAFVKAGGQL